MNKNYFSSLEDEDVKQRYLAKIKMCGGLDPYCIPKSELSRDPADVPKVTYFDLAGYLVNAKSSYTLESFKAHKSLSAFKYFEAGWVQEIGIKKIQDKKSIVIGKVSIIIYII